MTPHLFLLLALTGALAIRCNVGDCRGCQSTNQPDATRCTRRLETGDACCTMSAASNPNTVIRWREQGWPAEECLEDNCFACPNESDPCPGASSATTTGPRNAPPETSDAPSTREGIVRAGRQWFETLLIRWMDLKPARKDA